METYSPSIDWGNEVVPSLLWILKAWGVSAVCVLIICVLLVRYTAWGRQFWRISGDYFKAGKRSGSGACSRSCCCR